MLSDKEGEILLVLFKDFTTWYNATSISKIVKITPRGSLKALNKLVKSGLITSKKFGKANQYNLNFNNLSKKTIELLLLEESEKKHRRWVYEFEKIEKTEIMILFGSVTRKNKDYRDVDLLLVIKEKNYKEIIDQISSKNKILIKPVHPIFQTIEDLRKNILKKDKVIIDALKTGIVLKGQKEIVEVIENVTSIKPY